MGFGWDRDNNYVWLLGDLVKKAWKHGTGKYQRPQDCTEMIGWDLSYQDKLKNQGKYLNH